MRRLLPLLLLCGLAGCNRHGVADVTLDADAAQRNATAAKTQGDLAAADAASRGPAPVVHDAPPATASAPAHAARPAAPLATQEDEAAAPVDETADTDTNG